MISYRQAHYRAEKKLGQPPQLCSLCGCEPTASKDGRRTMQLYYTGTSELGYDPEGDEYIWACVSCNQNRPVTRARLSASKIGKPRPDMLGDRNPMRRRRRVLCSSS